MEDKIVGDGLTAENANWSFSGEVSKNFDQHISRSVPLYHEGHDLVCKISDFFLRPDSLCYELGCSTGTLSVKLAERNKHKENVKIIGIDREVDMINKANEKKGSLNIEFICDDILQYELEKSDLIVCYYTVQFIRPSERQRFIDKIYASLKWGGALILFEKIRACDARFQDIATSLYNDFKLNNGYSPDQIVAKARSLIGILEPFSTNGNLDLMKRANFVDIITMLKYISFEGFLAIK